MSAHDVHHDVPHDRAPADLTAEAPRSHRGRAFWNWVLAFLTIPGALAVVAFAYVSVLGTAGCTDGRCGGVGPSETVFGLILYGTPVVAVVAVALSFFTARRRLGFLVPAVAWALLVAAAVILVVTF